MKYQTIRNILFALSLLFFLSQPVLASSDRAYQDYLFQSDVYRKAYNDFDIAKNEYLKFKTLASEATVINKTKEMLSQRSTLLRAYLLFLQAKLDEAQGMSESDRQLYVSYITNEVAFLENHSTFIESVATLKDLDKASEQLEKHYSVLSLSIRQIILGLTTARLTTLGDSYSNIMVSSQLILNQGKLELPLDRQLVLDRWFQQISNKRTLFLQKIDAINAGKANLKGNKPEEIQGTFLQLLPLATQAKQELREGTSYISELLNAMRFKD